MNLFHHLQNGGDIFINLFKHKDKIIKKSVYILKFLSTYGWDEMPFTSLKKESKERIRRIKKNCIEAQTITKLTEKNVRGGYNQRLMS
jgi:hypothetical protein